MPQKTPDYLYKYLDVEGALAVVQTGTLRWSTVDHYKDPFELSTDSGLGFEIDSLLDSTVKLASSMIFAPEAPKGDSPLISAINRWREEGRFGSPAEASTVLRELLSKMVEHRTTTLEANLSQWQQYIRNQLLCSFSARPDSIQAWEKFALKHTGIAFRFAFDADPFSSAQAVIYQSERPNLTSIREQLGATLHNRKDSMVERYQDLYLIKSNHCKTEVEWRSKRKTASTIQVDRTDTENWYEDIAFDLTALNGVLFGLSCSQSDKKRIADAIKEQKLTCKFFQATLAKSAYDLEFEKVSL